ncbi:MAG: transporter substrate-binding domain-containing protein [Gammaproteobacteria bacterium]|jgi:polar amino acid transport system substrate-binding protein
MRNLTLLLLISFAAATAGCGRSSQSQNEPATSESAKPASVATCRITMGWDPWKPYEYEDEHGNLTGLDVDLVRAMAKAGGCTIVPVHDNWLNLIRKLQSGKLDMLPGATRTQARIKYAYFSNPYREETFLLYGAAEKKADFTADSLRKMLSAGFRLGVTEGYVYGDKVSRLQNDPRYAADFVTARVSGDNLDRLLAGKIDGFLEDPFVATAEIHAHDAGDRITAYPLKIHNGRVHLMFSQVSVTPQTIARFNRGLATIRADGTYDRIIARYKD